MESDSESTNHSRRLGKNQSLDEWYARKEEKRTLGKRKGLSRSKGLPRTPLNKVSKKQKKKNHEINKAYKEHYSKEENQQCFLCGRRDGLSVHHIKKRTEGNYSNQETFVTLCLIGDYMDKLHPELNHSHSGGCHSFLEANKSWARLNEFLV